jgi:hypothetical protein
MRTQDALFQAFVLVVLTLTRAAVAPSVAWAQALYAEHFDGGTELVLVTQSLSSATTLSWPESDGVISSRISGELTLFSDLETHLGKLDPPPPVVVMVGGAPVKESRAAVERAMGGRKAWKLPSPAMVVEEGGIDRRLGEPGSEGLIRLELPLPPPADRRRSAVELLWEMIPQLLAPKIPQVRTRIDGERALLETRVDPELAQLTLSRLRIALAQVAENQLLESSRVGEARRRVEVQRQALLGTHPGAAETIVSRWLAGGVPAVREFLFGLEGVTLESIRATAREWLPQHPGLAVLVLPPRVFNPRFAPGPERVQLANDVVAELLERPSAALSVLCLRPVVLPDVDGALTATVLARVAAELRAGGSPPGWIRVLNSPPVLEIAAEIDGLGESVEVVQDALSRVASDDRPVELGDAGARRRALQMMGGLLGLSEGMGLTPAELLQPGNLALGVVAPDGETAVEALQKFRFGGGGSGSTTPASRSMKPAQRTREAAPGGQSVLVVAVDFGLAVDEIVAEIVAELMRSRAVELEAGDEVELLLPFVPGRKVLLLAVESTDPLDELERRTLGVWNEITRPVDEDELAPIRRRIASRTAAAFSGPLGRARKCAAVAAGVARWRVGADVELAILTQQPDEVTAVLGLLAPWEELLTTGAGVMPIPEID